ncbi:MAG: coproporphyrinogen III oxidase family protein, partial [Bdellovibrionales bacterium]|nr:coproporphyrinogen III oxidase family protein [Bdellovibrionales bacterium]
TTLFRSQDTQETLRLVRNARLNYSFDLMFGLPHQTKDQLSKDLDEVLLWSPPHVSLYCLTVPRGNPLAQNRPSDEIQHEMFQLILDRLEDEGYERYEVSNFSKPGFRSRHNQLYWNDVPYWGIGVSSHSYLDRSRWGTRFWNQPQMETYLAQIQKEEKEGHKGPDPFSLLPLSQVEILNLEEAATDYCHTSLRRADGLFSEALLKKFGLRVHDEVLRRLKAPRLDGLLHWHDRGCFLTRRGWVLADQVFESVTFLAGELTFES